MGRLNPGVSLFSLEKGANALQNYLTLPCERITQRIPLWWSMSPALKQDGSLLMSEEEEVMAVACAVQNLHLMASTLGLAGMWNSKGLSVHPQVAQGLGLEAPARLLGFFICGWPSTEWLEGERRPLSEKVSWVENQNDDINV